MKKLASGLSAAILACALVGGTAYAQDATYQNDDASLQALIEMGGPVYNDNCAACHGANGEGGAGPSLIGSAVVKSRSALSFQILYGATDHGMPPFAPVLTDEEIAAVATYVRNSWTNEAGILLPRSVELRRAVPPEEQEGATAN
ncbi:c-type cytochrome [Devosia rhizoryzae]|uniref:Cytochrome c n=1 Tax=Devosia rhizoryzae TaxID=2774137 RepID=A0ABX7C722_9HYPH|nr:cytochrome c [Devosia rhizoryzae]QQR40013.1 cytochrome c [Devosia rhizoryzae]